MTFDHEIEKLLKSVAQDEGLTDFKIESASGALKGDGYLGVITGVQITGTDALVEKKTLHLVVKSATKNDAFRNEGLLANAFEREIYMYNTVIPVLQKFQMEKGLAPLESLAKCYKGCLMNKSEALVLEDLKHKGFGVWDRRIPMEHDHVKSVMTEMGRFHALSFALRDQNPERFEKLASCISEIFFANNTGCFRKMFLGRAVKSQQALDPTVDGEALEKYLVHLDQAEEFLMNLPTMQDRHSIILHGDCWTNNMMFKYEDTSDPLKPTKIVLIDLQLARCSSPVLDLSYFLYSSASKKAISNYEYFLDAYYDSLSEHVQRLGSDPEKVYSYQVFREDWKKHAKFGLFCCMLLSYAMMSEQDEVVDFTEVLESGRNITETFDYEISNIDEYHDRARHIILHFASNDFI